MEFLGSVFNFFAVFVLPLLIIICIILCIGKLLHNEKVKKITLFIFSAIYNVMATYRFFLLLFGLSLLLDMKITFGLAVWLFAIILIPINIYVVKKTEIKPALYIVLNIIIFVLSYYLTIIIRGSNL